MAYGTGTRSHLRSPEFHDMKRERKRATAEYEARHAAGMIAPMPVGPFCWCAQYPNPHAPHGRESAQQVAAVYRAVARRSE